MYLKEIPYIACVAKQNTPKSWRHTFQSMIIQFTDNIVMCWMIFFWSHIVHFGGSSRIRHTYLLFKPYRLLRASSPYTSNPLNAILIFPHPVRTAYDEHSSIRITIVKKNAVTFSGCIRRITTTSRDAAYNLQ